MSSNSISTSSTLATTLKTHILFLGIPETNDITNSDTLGIPIHSEDQKIFNNGLHELLRPERVDYLKTHLGPLFISHRGNKLVIHQPITTILSAY